MKNKIDVFCSSPWPAFGVLVVLNLGMYFYGIENGDFIAQMRAAVDALDEGYSGVKREEMAFFFLVISLIYYFFITIILGISIYFSQRGNWFSIFIAIFLIGVSIYEAVTSPKII